MSQPQSVGGSGLTPSHKKRNIIIVCGVVAFIVVGGAGYLIWQIIQTTPTDPVQKSTPQKVVPAAVCSTDIVKEANAPLATSDQIVLGKVVNKITVLKDYDHDPNCLYIALQYALASGNASSSRDLMTRLDKVYNPAIGFSDAFTVSVTPIVTLRKNVDFLVQSAAQNQEAVKQEDTTTADGSEAADKFHAENQ